MKPKKIIATKVSFNSSGCWKTIQYEDGTIYSFPISTEEAAREEGKERF